MQGWKTRRSRISPGKADRPALPSTMPQRVPFRYYHYFSRWKIVEITRQSERMHFIHKTLRRSCTTCQKSITSWMREDREKNTQFRDRRGEPPRARLSTKFKPSCTFHGPEGAQFMLTDARASRRLLCGKHCVASTNVYWSFAW